MRPVKLEIAKGENLSHFSLEANLLELQGELFQQYSMTGTGRRRFYLHTEEQADKYGQQPGTFTPWEEIPKDTDFILHIDKKMMVLRCRSTEDEVAQTVSIRNSSSKHEPLSQHIISVQMMLVS